MLNLNLNQLHTELQRKKFGGMGPGMSMGAAMGVGVGALGGLAIAKGLDAPRGDDDGDKKGCGSE
ncbi:far upstream element-binding protein 1-like [Gossypium australe]|uniref:Far upstream element-binding protein 1-like n=1 Tax=Gossypium australe TaxID=47621 RepID=A0A5B6W252_9ROSI|nr:far upstream element-binding protein 1-like [Gossypium australe]